MSRAVILTIALFSVAACGESNPPPAAAARPTQAAAPSAAAGAATPHDAVSEAAGSYRTAAAILPAVLERAGKGELTVTIEMTRPDVHVQKEFPLKVTLTGSTGLELSKGALGHDDATDPGAKGRTWKVGVGARAAGAQQVEVALRFAVCKEDEPAWCVVRNEKVMASVAVR